MYQSPDKKDLLWNVLEPGDPHDIRKSLIARIPGDRKIFMGDHVQMVCLLQAVEIQRLLEYLNDYKLKYKEIERNNFDRHYLEIQIKQLSEMNADSESLRVEVTKLREFIRRLSDELDLEKKKNKSVDESLQEKYEQALSQLEVFMNEKQQLAVRVGELEGSLGSWKSRYEALDKTRLRELEELRGDSQRQSQLDRELRELNSRLSLERSQYQSQIRNLKEQIQTKDREINEFHIQVSETNRSISLRQNQLLKAHETNQEQFKEQIKYLNNSLMTKSMEYQQLMIKYQTLITQTSKTEAELDEVTRAAKRYAEEVNMLNSSLHKLQFKLNERGAVDGKLEESQNQVALLSQEIARLEYMNTNKAKDFQDLTERYKKVGYEYESLRREYMGITNKLTELERAQGNIQELQTSLMRITQENSSLRATISHHEETIRRINGDFQKSQPQLLEVRRQLSVFSEQNIKFRGRINQLTAALDDASRSQTKVVDLEKRIRALENERDFAARESAELKSILESEIKRGTAEKETYQQKMRAMTDSHEEQLRAFRSQLDSTQRIGEDSELLKSNYTRVLDERDSLNEIAHKLQERLRSLGGEQRIIRFNEEIERLGRKLKEKSEELMECERRLKEYDHFKIKYSDSLHQIQTLRKKIQLLEPVQNKQHQYKIASLTKQVQSLRKQLNSQDFKAKIVDYQKRVTLFSDEIDRLNEKTKALEEQNEDWRERHDVVVEERDQLDRIAHELQERLRVISSQSGEVASLRAQIQDLTESNTMLERGYQNSQNEIERLKELAGEVHTQHEKKLVTMSHEIDRLNEVLKGKINQRDGLQKELIQLKRGSENIRILEEENTRLAGSLEILQGQNRGLENEIQASTVGLHSLKGENDGLRRRIGEMELSVRVIHDMEIERDQLRRQSEQRSIDLTAAHERLRSLTNDYERVSLELKSREGSAMEATRVTAQFNQRVSLLTFDNQRLKSQYDQSSKRNHFLQLQVQKLGNQIDLMSIKIREVDGYASKEQRYKFQIDRLNESVILKESQIVGLEKSITQLEIGRQKGVLSAEELERVRAKNSELVGKVSELESRVFSISSELEMVRTKLGFSEEKVRKLGEAESREVGLMREKEGVIAGLNEEISEYKQRMSRANGEWNIKVNTLENSIRILENQKESAERRLQQSRIEIKKLQETHSSLRAQFSQELNRREQDLELKTSTLKQRISSYELKIRDLISENQGLVRRITSYEFEVSDWKRKDAARAMEGEEMQRLRVVLSQMEIEKDGHRERLVTVGNEVERLNTVLKGKIEEIDQLNRRVNQLTQESNESRVRISQISGENEGLKLTVSDLNLKLQSLASTSNRAYELKIEQKNIKVQQYQNKLALLSQEIERLQEMKRSSSSKIQSLELSSNSLQRHVREYEEKILTLSNEVERLNGVLIIKLQLEQELGRLRLQNDRLHKSLQLKEQSQANATLYLQQIQRLNNALRIKVQESREMESSRHLSDKNDAKIATYSHEVERLNNQLMLKLEQNRELKQKIIEINRDSDMLKDRYSQAVRDYQASRRKYQETEEKLPRLNAEFDNLNRVLITQKQELTLLKQENYNLSVQLSNGSAQSVEEKNRMLAEEIKRLNGIIEQHMMEISELRLRYVDENALQKRINEHLSLFVVLFAEIESLRKRVKDKEKEVNDVRRSSLATYIVNNPT